MQAIKRRAVRPDDRTINLLGALVTALDDAMYGAIAEASRHGPSAAAALATVAACPGESLDALRRTLGLSAAGATRLVDRLEADGLIERRQGAGDGRSRAVVLTAAGHTRGASILAARRWALARPVASLSAVDRARLTRMLATMLELLTPDRATSDHTCRLCDIAACPQEACPVELAARRAEK